MSGPGSGRSFHVVVLVVVSCGRSMNDQVGAARRRMNSGILGVRLTATPRPISSFHAIRLRGRQDRRYRGAPAYPPLPLGDGRGLLARPLARVHQRAAPLARRRRSPERPSSSPIPQASPPAPPLLLQRTLRATGQTRADRPASSGLRPRRVGSRRYRSLERWRSATPVPETKPASATHGVAGPEPTRRGRSGIDLRFGSLDG